MAWEWNQRANDIYIKLSNTKQYSEYNLNEPASVGSHWNEIPLNQSSTKQRTYSTWKAISLTLRENNQKLFASTWSPSDLSGHSQHGMLEKPSVSWLLEPSTSEQCIRRPETSNSGGQQQRNVPKLKKNSLWPVKDEFNILGSMFLHKLKPHLNIQNVQSLLGVHRYQVPFVSFFTEGVRYEYLHSSTHRYRALTRWRITWICYFLFF